MLSFPRWLVLFALFAGGGHIFAAADSREERAYAAPAAAFHDKFYDRAATGFGQFLQNYRRSTNAPSATLLLAQSEYYLGRYTNAIARLSNSNTLAKARGAGIGDQYVYWRAQAEFRNGDFKQAAATFVSLGKDYPGSPLALTALVEGASAYAKLEQWTQVDKLLDSPDGAFEGAARHGGPDANGPVADGRLLQAESKCAQKDFAGALDVLKLLNVATLSPEQQWKRDCQFYRSHSGLGDLPAALSATTNLLGVARVNHGGEWPAKLAESVVSRAETLERLGQFSEAAAAWHENLADHVPADQQRQAVLKIAELSAAQTNFTAAEEALTKYLAQFPDASAADLAVLTLGELHLKHYLVELAVTNHLALAKTKFAQLTEKDPDGRFAGRAFLGLGWCEWIAGRSAMEINETNTANVAGSLADFSRAATRLPPSDDLAIARFKMADAQFVLGNLAGALTNYQAVLDLSALPDAAALGDQALYQILRTQLALHDNAGLDDAMNRLLGKFFTNAPATGNQLLEKFFKHTPGDSGLLLGGFGHPAKIRELFQRFTVENPTSPLLPEASFAMGRTYEQERDWRAAVANYQSWLKNYPTNELHAQVEYSRDWAVWQAGDEARAFELFNQFIQTYPSNVVLTPLAYWWVADHGFRLGDTNLVQAEQNYQLIFQYFPASDLASPAQLMAGRCAMARGSYTDAAQYFSALMTNNCADDLRDQARFGYCEALRQMPISETNTANLQTVTNLLAQMTAKSTTNLVGALAWSEMGDCNLQLGALDAATNAYAQVFISPAADPELWSRAKVGLGMALEKKAEGLPDDLQRPLLSLALQNYTDVIYTTNSVADAFWMKKAALQALSLMPLVKQGEANQFINSLEYWLPPLKDTLEKKRPALVP
jgi:TolA-binding protein